MRSLICMLLLGAAIVAAANEIPAENFAKRLEYHNAVISPGGDYIAIERSADEGKKLVAIVSTKNLELLGHMPAGSDYSPFDPVWANDERLIVHLTEDREGSEFEFANGELISLDFDGTKIRRIVEHQVAVSGYRDTQPLNALHGYAEVVHALPDQKNHVLIRFIHADYDPLGYKPSLYRIHVTRGTVKRIADAPTYSASFIMTAKGKLTYSVGLDADALKNGINKWVTHRFVDGEWELLDTLDVDADAFEVLASAGDTEVYLQLGYFNKPDRVYRYDVVTGEKKLLFAHAEVDPTAFDFDRRSGELIAVHFDDGYPNLHLVNEEHLYSQWYPPLFQAFGGNRVRITSSSDDGKLLLIHVSGDREPGQFRLFNTETRDMQYLFNAASWIDSEQLAEMQPVTFESRDGLKIHGFLTRPNAAEGPYPLVVMPHGGPYDVRDAWAYNSRAQFLASRGYAVLQINFRGSGGFGYGFEESAYGKWGTDIQHDIIDGTRWAAGQDDIDADRVCIVGASFGAYSALMAPTIEPDLYRCAAGLAGPYDLELMWTTADIESTRRGENYLEKAIGRDEATLRANSPLHRLDSLTVPVLLAHGKNDWRVDVKHFEKMTRALQDKNHPHDTLLIKREGHGFFDEENRLAYLKKLESFLEEHL